MPQAIIRLAEPRDLSAINDIYNHFVTRSTCTYQIDPSTSQEREQWFAAHGEKHPIIVAELDGQVGGWGSLSRYHPRAAYGRTVEDSVYVRHDLHGRGVGSAILEDLIARGRKLGHHTIMALIDSEQAGSIRLHERFGFRQAGFMRELGWKFDRWLHVVYMQLML